MRIILKNIKSRSFGSIRIAKKKTKPHQVILGGVFLLVAVHPALNRIANISPPQIE